MAGLLVEEAVGDLLTECLCHLGALEAEVVVWRHRSVGSGTFWEIEHTATTLRRRTWRLVLDHDRHNRRDDFHMPTHDSASTARQGQSSSLSRKSTDRGFLKVCNFSCPFNFFSCITTNKPSRLTTRALVRAATRHCCPPCFCRFYGIAQTGRSDLKHQVSSSPINSRPSHLSQR
jgi:hypothetical protein